MHFLSGAKPKDHGYQFGHSFGHGKQNLSSILAMLMMLAFLVDQTQAAIPGEAIPLLSLVSSRPQKAGESTILVGPSPFSLPSLPSRIDATASSRHSVRLGQGTTASEFRIGASSLSLDSSPRVLDCSWPTGTFVSASALKWQKEAIGRALGRGNTHPFLINGCTLRGKLPSPPNLRQILGHPIEPSRKGAEETARRELLSGYAQTPAPGSLAPKRARPL